MEEKIRIGISACLLGEKVRYDGGDKLDAYLKETLGRQVEYVPVCPEVGMGLPVPREPMRLTGEPSSPRLVTVDTGIDMTERMLSWARKRVSELAREGLSGFVFKSRSPSCGIGSGIFAKVFTGSYPLLPVEDEVRLRDPELRERFIERVFGMDGNRRA